jgi:hypothetical protein
MTTDGRLSTELWVSAHLRRCNDQGLFAAVLRKGDAWGGAIDGNVAWLGVQQGALMTEADATAYIERQVKRDPDLWVVEIEDKQGRNPFEGKIV